MTTQGDHVLNQVLFKLAIMKLNKHFLVFNYFIFSLIAFFISNNTTAQIDGGIAEYNASLERNANYNPCDILFGCSTAFVEAGDSDPPSPTIKSVTKGWMGKLPDTTPMNRISIPGTHDSGTRYTLPVANTQNWTIKEQLEAGIRQFDLRVRTGFDSENLFFDNCFDNCSIVDTGVVDSPTEMSNSCCGNITGWDIYHGAIPNGDGSGKVLTFDQVFDWMTEFLNKKENEKEALIVNIQTAENGKGDPYLKLYEHYQTKYSGFWKDVPSNFTSPAGVITIPKLGDLRKKIFVINKQPELLTFNSWGGQADCGFSCDLRGATDHLDSAPGDPDPNIWYKTTFDLLPPSVMAPNSNRLLFEYLNTLSSKTPLGIISSDFPGEGLIYRIIKTNFNFKKRID